MYKDMVVECWLERRRRRRIGQDVVDKQACRQEERNGLGGGNTAAGAAK